jgi:hypothetical protein
VEIAAASETLHQTSKKRALWAELRRKDAESDIVEGRG